MFGDENLAFGVSIRATCCKAKVKKKPCRRYLIRTYMIPANTYVYLCCMSSCVFWPLLCVMAGVRQAHQHLSNGYPNPIFFIWGSTKKQLH